MTKELCVEPNASITKVRSDITALKWFLGIVLPLLVAVLTWFGSTVPGNTERLNHLERRLCIVEDRYERNKEDLLEIKSMLKDMGAKIDSIRNTPR